MPAVTGDDICSGAFQLLNVFLPGEALSASAGETARVMLNDMLSEWSQRPLFIPVISRERFDLVANQGGTSNPYTIGIGADFNTVKPANQNSIVSANLILTASSPEVRVPLGIYTDQAYDANQIPDTSNGQPTGLYYSPTYATSDWGTINLWPVPDVSANDLELFIQQAVAQFADLSTTYYVPAGLPRTLKYNLADALQVPFGKNLSDKAQRIAVSSLGTFKRANTKLSDVMNDAYMFTYGRRTVYNINTGAGG